MSYLRRLRELSTAMAAPLRDRVVGAYSSATPVEEIDDIEVEIGSAESLPPSLTSTTTSTSTSTAPKSTTAAQKKSHRLSSEVSLAGLEAISVQPQSPAASAEPQREVGHAVGKIPGLEVALQQAREPMTSQPLPAAVADGARSVSAARAGQGGASGVFEALEWPNPRLISARSGPASSITAAEASTPAPPSTQAPSSAFASPPASESTEVRRSASGLYARSLEAALAAAGQWLREPVIEPPAQAPVEPPESLKSLRSMDPRRTQAQSQGASQETTVELSIGSIQVTVDAPPAPPPVTATQPQREPEVVSPTRLGRFYLRGI